MFMVGNGNKAHSLGIFRNPFACAQLSLRLVGPQSPRRNKRPWKSLEMRRRKLAPRLCDSTHHQLIGKT